MLPETVIGLIGKTGETTIMEVEKGAIKRFADAIEDFNPRYWDDEYARTSRFGAIVAPSGFFGWPTSWPEAGPTFSRLREEVINAITQAGFPRLLDGGIEYDFYGPVRAGDILATSSTITSVYERETRGGKMLLSVMETSYVNQNGKLVAKARQTLIHR